MENKTTTIIQRITQNNLVDFNMHIVMRQPKMLINQIITICLSVFLGFLSMIREEKSYILLGLAIVILIYATVLFWPIQKKIVKNHIIKKTSAAPINILVDLNEEGMLYKLVNEDASQRFAWNEIGKVIITPKYIYFYINSYTTLFVVKEGTANIEEFEKVITHYLNENINVFFRKK